MNLTDRSLKTGTVVRVTGFTEQNIFCERLHEMGVGVGTDLTILGRMPFKGPLLVRFHTSFMALRHQEAACTLVTPLK